MGAVLRDFFRWWFGQLADLIPGSRRDAGAQRNAVLIVAPEPTARPGPPLVAARIERRGRAEPLGTVALDAEGLNKLKRAAATLGRSPETLIELPVETMLEKRLTLPLAAERDLDRVLSFEMDRETPFAADEVYWGSDIEKRDRTQRRLVVRLAMVAKAPLADLAAALSRAGLHPTALIGIARQGQRTIIPLNRDVARRRGVAGYLVPVLGWGCAVLLIAAVGLPFLQQGLALDQVDDEIEAVRPTVEAVEKVRQHIAGDRQQAENLAAQRAQFGDPLVMLAAVTAALPDDTCLTELDFSMGKLTLTGQSKAAAHLIGDLSGKAAFKDPAFSAPVTRVERGKFDVFTISAQLRN